MNKTAANVWIGFIKKVGVKAVAKGSGVSPVAVYRWIDGSARPYGDNRKRFVQFMKGELSPEDFVKFIDSLQIAILGDIT